MRQTELSLSKPDRQIVHEFRSKGLHIGRTLLHCSQGEPESDPPFKPCVPISDTRLTGDRSARPPQRTPSPRGTSRQVEWRRGVSPLTGTSASQPGAQLHPPGYTTSRVVRAN